MYPTADSLNTLELLYGEAVSRADLDGLAAEAHRQAMLEQKRLEKVARAKGDHHHVSGEEITQTLLIYPHKDLVTHTHKTLLTYPLTHSLLFPLAHSLTRLLRIPSIPLAINTSNFIQ